MVSAKAWSWLSLPTISGLSAAASSAVMCFTASSGEVRSGSEKRMSKATTAAPSPLSVSSSLAMVVRGHGHWPILASDSSSTSTILTGRLGS